MTIRKKACSISPTEVILGAPTSGLPFPTTAYLEQLELTKIPPSSAMHTSPFPPNVNPGQQSGHNDTNALPLYNGP